MMPSHRSLRRVVVGGFFLAMGLVALSFGEAVGTLRGEEAIPEGWPRGLVLIVGVPRQVMAVSVKAEIAETERVETERVGTERGDTERDDTERDDAERDDAERDDAERDDTERASSEERPADGDASEADASAGDVVADDATALAPAARHAATGLGVDAHASGSRRAEQPTIGLRRGWGVVLQGEEKSVLMASHLVLDASDWCWEAWRRDESGWLGTTLEVKCVDPFSDWASFQLVEELVAAGTAAEASQTRDPEAIDARESGEWGESGEFREARAFDDRWPAAVSWLARPSSVGLEPSPSSEEAMESTAVELFGLRSPEAVIAGADPLGVRCRWVGERGAIRLPGADASERIACLRELGGLEGLTAENRASPWPGPLLSAEGACLGWVTPWAIPPGARDGLAPLGAWGIRLAPHQQRVVNSVLAGQIPRFGFLGIRTQEVSDAVRARGWHGVSVYDVLPATPAATAGLQYGDLITHLDGEPMVRAETLLWELAIRGPEALVRLTVARGVLTERPTSDIVEVRLASRSKSTHPESLEAGTRLAGESKRWELDWITAAPFFDQIAQGRWPAAGVWVVSVPMGSAVWEAGLRPDDVIVSVDDMPVSRPAEFVEHCRAAGGLVELRLRHPSSEEERVIRISSELLVGSE